MNNRIKQFEILNEQIQFDFTRIENMHKFYFSMVSAIIAVTITLIEKNIIKNNQVDFVYTMVLLVLVACVMWFRSLNMI